jgi:hypothetical protein
MRLLALALVLAQVVAPTPTAWSVSADPALVLALRVLAGVDEDRALLQALADAGVRLVVAVEGAPEAGGSKERLAESGLTTRVIGLSPRVRADVAPRGGALGDRLQATMPSYSPVKMCNYQARG